MVLLLLLAVLLLRLYKAISGYNKIDKFTFSPISYKAYDLSKGDFLSSFLSILLKNQSKVVHLIFVVSNLIFILLAEIVSSQTLFIALINFTVLL